MRDSFVGRALACAGLQSRIDRERAEQQSRREFLPVVFGLTIASCRGNRKRKIAVIPKATSHVFWLSVQKGAFAAGEEFGVDILWNGPPQETEYARQIQIVDSMVAQRVDGIAIAAAERKALVSCVERAVAAGIPVTVFDSGLDSQNYLSYVATDNVEAGRLGARTLGVFDPLPEQELRSWEGSDDDPSR